MRFAIPCCEARKEVIVLRRLRYDRRPGSIAPVIAISLVGLCGAVALAVDVGRVAVAKLQCQTAVDVAAMAGARTLNGIMPQDLTSATTNAQNAAITYQIMGHSIVASELRVYPIRGTKWGRAT